jgi:hypothetical protein
MSISKKKSPITKNLQLLVAFGLGFSAWAAGLHCLELDTQGRLSLSFRKFLKHLFKLFLWTAEIVLVYQVIGFYRSWLMQASGSEIAMAFLVKSVIFLYVKVFWPRVFPEILPGLHVFFCPQCFQKQTFRFQPFGLPFGFFVTYLCRYCSCFVNAWGEQIFYPLPVTLKKCIPALLKTLVPVLLVILGGFCTAEKILAEF